MNGAIWLVLAAGAAAGPLNASVMSLLDAYEAPVDAASVRALGEGAAAELVAVAKDPSVPPTRRARAITALRYVEATDEVATALRDHLASESLLRRHAALSLAAVLGAAAIDDLEPLLADDDAQVRIAAARGLGRIGTERARAVLSARAAVETVPAVVEALDEARGTP